MAKKVHEEDQGVLQQALTLALQPIQIATSRPAIKAYLSAILFLAASAILVTVSTTAYLLFYYNYIPQIGLSLPVHLQYGDDAFPHSNTALSSSSTSSLVSLQPYDILINLHLPKTPTNLATGNFMLDLTLFSTSNPGQCLDSVKTSIISPTRSRRPAIVPYHSPLTTLTHTLLSLPLNVLSLRDPDSLHLVVPMFELVSFPRGSRSVPTCARLEIQSQAQTQAALLSGVSNGVPVPLQVYSTSLEFHARFQGLRWVMYNWRVTSFMLFSIAFYLVATGSMLAAWLVLGKVGTGGAQGKKNVAGVKKEVKQEDPQIKKEEDADKDSETESGLSLSNLSENAANFPTLGRQLPIRYPVRSGNEVQSSAAGGAGSRDRTQRDPILDQPIPVTTAGEFAEDEDDTRGRERDSGIGTSMEESLRDSAGLQRRRSGRGRGES